MSLRFTIPLGLSFVSLSVPTLASDQVQTFTATHTYIMGDHDSKDDARQRCLLEAKRKILEQAGVCIEESASEVKNFDLTKDKITSFAAAVMQVRHERRGRLEQGHMTLTLHSKRMSICRRCANNSRLRQVDTDVREDVAAQKERLRRLEAHLTSRRAGDCWLIRN